MSRHSRLTAGILLLLFPLVVYGGTSILGLLVGSPEYASNPLRRDLWRAGHAHAGVLLILSLVTLRYVDEAKLPGYLQAFARHSVPASAVLIPAAFSLSVLSPDATEPNGIINPAFIGAGLLAAGLLVTGVGLVRKSNTGAR